MPNYIIAYHGGNQPETPEEGAKHMAKWKAWVSDLGDAIVNPGTPLGKSTMVTADCVSDDAGDYALSGFSMVKADNLDAALEMAKSCPFHDVGGTLEVAQVMEMN